MKSSWLFVIETDNVIYAGTRHDSQLLRRVVVPSSDQDAVLYLNLIE